MKKCIMAVIILAVIVVFTLVGSIKYISAATERIVFVSARDGNNEIYIMNVDGTGQTRLTNNSANDNSPIWSPGGDKIVFSSYRDGNYEIYMMNADGNGQTRLTNNTYSDTSPTWSPDGSKIAFTSNRDGNNEIYIMNADGSGSPTRLTNNSVSDSSPSWSPNGTKIAYTSNNEIYVMNADGTGQTRLTNNTYMEDYPVWSPDGSKIAFTSNRNGNNEIYVMNADGSTQTRLTNNSANDSLATWSPDGSKIAFTSYRDGNYEIYVMNVDGSSQTRITNNTAIDNYPSWRVVALPGLLINDGDTYVNSYSVTLALSQGTSSVTEVSFSNDGTTYTSWETFSTNKSWNLSSGDGTKTVYVQFKDSVGNISTYSDAIILDTTAPTGSILIQNGDTYAKSRTVPLTLSASDTDGSGVDQMCFSNDGITYSAWETYTTSKKWLLSNGNGVKTVYVRYRDKAGNIITANDTIAIDITEKIVFTSNRDGNYEVYSMNPDGSGLTRLTNTTATESSPVWSPVNDKIAFVSNRDGNNEIYIMNGNGSDPIRLTNNTAIDENPSWSPDGTKIAFTSTRDGNNEIYVMNADGSGTPTRLTSNSVYDGAPSWSPDGAKIAYTSNNEIYVMNANGSSQTRLTNNSVSDSSPVWSPDGTKIVYISNPNSNYDIYVMNANGSSQTRLIGGSYTEQMPWWSPDGSKIVFVSNRSGYHQLYTVNADGTNLSQLTTNTATDQYPCWREVITPPGMIIVDGAPLTNTPTVTLNLFNGGNPVSEMSFSNDGETYSAWEAFDISKSWVLSNGDGLKTVYVQFKDSTGNISTYSDTIILDTTAPTGSIVIQNGDTYAKSRTVPLTLSANDTDGSGVDQMSFSNDGTTYSAWEGYTTNKKWVLSSGNGVKTVYVRYRDKAGNVITTNDTIAIDITEKIVFTSNRDGNYEIYSMNPDGSGLTRLTNNTATESSPVWSPVNDKIAFVSNRDGNNEIYVMNGNGSDPIRLTNNIALDETPTWSPDGTKIAFTSNRDGNYEIYVMNADGSGTPTRLTSNSVSDGSPSWSPDGTKIAYASYQSNTEIYVMNANGSSQTRLTNNSVTDSSPVWSPDGTKIVYVSYPSSNYEIYVMNANGSSQTRLTSNSYMDQMPWWSPDGSKIVFVSNRSGYHQLYTMNADGTNQTQLTTNTATDHYPCWREVISPPGMSIADGAPLTNNPTVILNLFNGGNPVSEMSFSNDGTTYSAWEAFDTGKSWVLSNGDGLKTVYVQFKDSTGNISTYSDTIILDTTAPTGSIVIQNGDTYAKSRTVPLTLSANDTDGSGVDQMSFSNDGTTYSDWEAYATSKKWVLSSGNGVKTVYVRYRDKAGNVAVFSDTIDVYACGKIVFASNRDGNNEIYIMNPDGTALTRLTFNSTDDNSPVLSPEGNKIAYVSGSGINVMNTDGTNQIQLTSNNDKDPAWSPDGRKIVFASNRDGNYEIYIINADGSGTPTRLTSNSVSDSLPSWSPDGTKIAYTSNGEIYAMNTNGSGQIRLTNNSVADYSPVWSPDGQKIAFTTYRDGNNEIYTMNSSDGSDLNRLTTNTIIDDSYPAWSPDGTKLVFVSDAQIFTMHNDGSQQTQLTFHIAIDQRPFWGTVLTIPSTPPTPIPTLGVTIADGADYTNTTSVMLTLYDGGSPVSEMCFSNDGTNYSSWEPYTTSKAWELGVGDGNKTVYAQFKDASGNIFTYRDTIILDTMIPSGSIIIKNNDTYTTSRIVSLSLSGNDNDGSGIDSMSFSNDGVSYSAWEPFNTTKDWALRNEDGTKTVYVRYRDKAGNIAIFDDVIILDAAPPQGSILINDGEVCTTTLMVTLSLFASDDASGISHMRFSNDGTTYSDWEAYTTIKENWELLGEQEGRKTVYVQYQDLNGNVSTYNDSIIYDVTKPQNCRITINNGNEYAESTEVSLLLTASDASGIKRVRFSNDGFIFSVWMPYQTNMSWELEDGDGPKTVYAQFEDYANHQSDICQDSIVLDQDAPKGKVLIQSGAVYTSTTSVILNLYARDEGSGISMVRFSNDGSNWSPWGIYLSRNIEEYPLSNDSNNTKTVYVQFKDNLGRVSSVISDTIELRAGIQPEALHGNPIVFATIRDGNSEIYVMNEDGTCQKNLTNNSAEDTSPCWSYDQYKIVFVSNRDGNKELYLMDPDGTNQERVTNNTTDDDMPVFSKDGKKIAFVSNRDGHNEIYLYDVQKKTEIRLTNCNTGESASHPSWLPDGTELVYELSINGIGSIYRVNLTDGTTSCLLQGGSSLSYSEPVWSPDGFNLAVVRNFGTSQSLYVTNREQNMNFTLASGTIIQHPTWDPNSCDIAYSTNNSGTYEIYRVNVLTNGGPVTQITNQSLSTSPSWGGIADWLVGLTERHDKYDFNDQLYYDWVYITNADRYSKIRFPGHDSTTFNFTSLRPLLNMFTIVYTYYGSDDAQICTSRVDNLNSKIVLYQDQDNLSIRGPIISPDGSKIVFSGRDDSHGSNGGIFLITINPNDPDNPNAPVQKLISNSDITGYPFYEYAGPSWSPDSQFIYYNRIATVDSSFNTLVDLWRMDLLGTNLTRIVNWMQDERSNAIIGPSSNIAFAGKNSGTAINLYVLPATNYYNYYSILSSNTDWISPLNWSPDEKKILFTLNGDYYLIYYQSGYGDKVKIDLFK